MLSEPPAAGDPTEPSATGDPTEPIALAAVAGHPVAHSISPQMHNAAYQALGLTGWSYGRADVTESAFGAFLAGLGPQWRGLSLTMPLKEVVFGCDVAMSGLAVRVGSANTLVRRPGLGWAGDNTDVHGAVAALLPALAGLPASARPHDALVLGSGATARSVLAALHELGIHRVELAVRDQPRPRTLALAAELGIAIRTGPLSQAAGRMRSVPVVVSTLPPAGAAGVASALAAQCPGLDPTREGHTEGHTESQSEGHGEGSGVLLDVVYAGWPTPLARAFAASGGQVVSGFEMVLHQGAEQVRLMTGMEPPLDAMRQAGQEAIAAASAASGRS